MTKPFSQASENNKTPIVEVLERVFDISSKVLEIGSGTGQHAVHFSTQLTHLEWQPTDRAENLPGIEMWCSDVEHNRLNPPKPFDVLDDNWPVEGVDAVFSANTAHIMPWDITVRMIERVGEKLPTGGVFALYGPFNYEGKFTSESNANFDAWLRQQHPAQGIRDFEKMNALAEKVGLSIFEDNTMPANNRLLVWVKQSGIAGAGES
ncbi:DUF938 domain-containing protein [Teredinibacter purpureus]|uniref:DUF938 domain-containing protein n=1 Tax=Teredinibacter purpureus TaxID=2731756 RepID=UPI0005F87831|nr:DUF938 domain-containing protein [Teredinibacter purpureus]